MTSSPPCRAVPAPIRLSAGITRSVLFGLTLTIFSMSANAAMVQLVQSFGSTGAADPNSALIQTTDGSFYSVSQSDSSVGFGTVYRFTLPATITTLHQFNGADGALPGGQLIIGADGDLYGVTSGGTGTSQHGSVFKITPSGTLTTLRTLDGSADGNDPHDMVAGADGNFYGIVTGGAAQGVGGVFRVTPAGGYSIIRSFGATDSDGLRSGAFALASDGNFYGVSTDPCNPTPCGSIYRLTPSGIITTLYSFTGGADGGRPLGKMVQATDGNFYGTTSHIAGGPGVNGTVFRITPAGALTTLHTFDGADGNSPVGQLVQAADGNLYGATYNGGGGCGNCGVVFSVSPAGAFTLVHSFTGADGAFPTSGLYAAADGNLYGTANSGGASDTGAIYSVTFGAALAPPGGVTATGGNGQATVSWTASSGASTYNVYVGTAAGAESSTPAGSGVSGTSFTVTGLANGTTYFFKVASVAGATTSALSTEASATPVAPPPPLPAQVSGLAATAGAAQVSLTWSATSNATAYMVAIGTASGAETVLASGVSATTYTATGLTNGTKYYFTVTATNAGGNGPASAEAVATPSAGTVATPTISPAGGSYSAAQSVTLADATAGAVIYYTTDGSVPTASSTPYTTPFKVTNSATVQAIATETGYQPSAVAGAIFTITPPAAGGGGAFGGCEALALLLMLAARAVRERLLGRSSWRGRQGS